jgi:hypothetical protein
MEIPDESLVRLLMPELQGHGVFRREYKGGTLRDYLFGE